MELTLFNGYMSDTLEIINRLTQEKECECCKHGIEFKNDCGYYFNCKNDDIECEKGSAFIFSGIKEIKIDY